ncbi:MAG: RNA methyltransferase [Anaerolineae bacterium]|nr:RNA methyltransferase [Anaerolineae bacterium]
MMITSPQNDRVKLVRQLQRQAKVRRKQRQWVLEGVRLIADAITNGARPDFVLYTAESAPDTLIAQWTDAGILCLEVTPDLMREMADTETPQGMIGVFPWPDLPIPDAPDLIVVADGWRDPGNLGTLIRTAAAAGVDLVALPSGTVDFTNPKVVRAGMGAHFRVPVHALAWPDLIARYPDHAIYLAEMGGAVVYDAVDWTQPAILAIGGEAFGAGDALRDLLHTTIRIPMVAGAESLNAGVAASIVIYAARRHTLA